LENKSKRGEKESSRESKPLIVCMYVYMYSGDLSSRMGQLADCLTECEKRGEEGTANLFISLSVKPKR